tara:strand:+ start:3016 stop:3639 length:624 start_codon:yes stop_codon:yes gene_type:complete
MTVFNYEYSETQRVIEEMVRIAPGGFRGGVIMSADGQKTKNLSISVEQAQLIQSVLVNVGTDSGRTKSCPSVSIEVTVGAFDTLKASYDVFIRCNAEDEVVLDTRSIPDSELENIGSILKVEIAEIEECFVVVYHAGIISWGDIIPKYTCDWAVSDHNGIYILETDDKQEALDRIKEENKALSSQDEEGSCALMIKDPDGEGYTLCD